MQKGVLPILVFLFCSALEAQITINYTTSTTPVTCYGGSDGSATITSITGGVYFNSSTKGLLISEVYANPLGTDSAYEFVELLATRFIDFSTTPYTVIFCNNGTATASGWIAGTSRSYAFQINSGTVNAGDVVYVGGTQMIPLTNRIRVINTVSTGGDGGIGNAATSGVLGNGGVNCDGVAVFNLPVASITSASVPIDALFFGTGIGTAYVSPTTGYELPNNDYYSGGKLQTTSYFAMDATSGRLIKANFGIYNVASNTFTSPRVWTADTISNFTNLTSSLLLDNLYNVNWSNAVSSVYNPNLTAGNYTFTISDQIGTTATGSVNIADGQLISMTINPTDAFACEGDSIGLVAAAADTYLWSTGATGSTTGAVVTSDTSFIVIGTDTVTGCSNSDTVFIDVNPYPVVAFSLPNDSVCNDGGTINMNATPPGGVYTGTGVSGNTLDPSALSGLNSVTYTYTDPNGCMDDEQVFYTVLNCTGVEDEEYVNISVYPNPVMDKLYIETNIPINKFSIVDLTGKLVWLGNMNGGTQIDLNHLNPGIYLIDLEGRRFKIIKN